MSAWIPVEGIILQTECRCLNFLCTTNATHDTKFGGKKVWKTLFFNEGVTVRKVIYFGAWWIFVAVRAFSVGVSRCCPSCAQASN